MFVLTAQFRLLEANIEAEAEPQIIEVEEVTEINL